MAFKTLYTAKATVTGGRQGHGRTDDGVVDVNLSQPEGMGGPGGPGTNPEQLFAVGYGACFQGALAHVAQEAGHDASESTLNSAVEIGKTADGLGIRVTLDVHIPGVDDETAAELVRAAHAFCPYSKATRGNIDVILQANGSQLAG